MKINEKPTALESLLGVLMIAGIGLLILGDVGFIVWLYRTLPWFMATFVSGLDLLAITYLVYLGAPNSWLSRATLNARDNIKS
jgi:hypothetical protein